MFDKEISEVVTGFDNVLKNRIEQLDGVIEARMNQFQEMMNGIKITNNIEMPVVKKAESVTQA